MCNTIFINKDTVPEAEDGEEVEVTIKAIYRTDEDGIRRLEPKSVDGEKVAEEGECGCNEEPDLMEQDADDAMRIFFIKTRKGK